jgi:hypothetical protein
MKTRLHWVAGLIALAVAGTVLVCGARSQAASRAAASALGAPVVSSMAGGVGGPGLATGVSMGHPCALTVAGRSLLIDSSSVLLLGQGTVVRAVSTGSDQLTTPVGSGFPGLTPDGTPGTQTESTASCGVAADAQGNIIWSDSLQLRFIPEGINEGSDLIRMLAVRSGTFYGVQMTAGRTYTIAGGGGFGSTGNGIPATSAALSGPAGLAVDGNGNVVFADTNSGRIRVIAASTGSYYGQQMAAGDIYTIAGGGTSSGSGVQATTAMLSLWTPNGDEAGVRIDSHGNVVFADCSDNQVRVVAAASGTFYGQKMAKGDIYAVAGDGKPGDSGDGGLAATAAVGTPQQLAIDHAGNIIVSQGQVVRIIAEATGTFYGRHMSARHIYPLMHAMRPGLAVDGSGNLLISRYSVPGDQVELLANRTGTDFGRHVTAGSLTTVAGNGQPWDGGDGGAMSGAQLGLVRNEHEQIVSDTSGDVAFIDESRVRFIPKVSGRYFGRHMTGGHIYPVVGAEDPGSIVSSCARAGHSPALAQLMEPAGLAFDHRGNLVVDDLCGLVEVLASHAGRYYGRPMRAGGIYPIGSVGHARIPGAGLQFDGPWAVAVDPAGNVVLAVTYDARVKVLAERAGTFYGLHMVPGRVYTIAGNGGTVFSQLGGLALRNSIVPTTLILDHFGDVIIGDRYREDLIAEHAGSIFRRMVIPGHIYQIATEGPTVTPQSIRVDPSNNLIFAGFAGIGVVAASTGTFYGQPMTADKAYIVAPTAAFNVVAPAFSSGDADLEAVGIAPGGQILVIGGGRIWRLSS